MLSQKETGRKAVSSTNRGAYFFVVLLGKYVLCGRHVLKKVSASRTTLTLKPYLTRMS